jgi:uncharacterized protein (TIGR00299 family) protein
LVKIAYFDCFSGISGDMCLGALVDAGAPLEEIARRLKRLPVKGYTLAGKKVRRAGFAATKVDVLLHKKGAKAAGRKWPDIRNMISTSSLPDNIKGKGLHVFRTLFEAEAKVHGRNLNEVHLHELGAVDCLIDIFGTLTGLDLLGVEEIYCSPVNLGGGTVKTSHGILPAPAPATAEIVKGMPVYSSGATFELTTPTGAAILKSLSKGMGEMPVFTPEMTGSGAGSKDPKDMPNLLRIFIGESRGAACRALLGKQVHETVTVIETNIDDMNPQLFEFVSDRLFALGALDVFLTQVVMKKMRPAVKLSVLCEKAKRNDIISLILRETTSIGVRYYETSRVTMERQLRAVSTKYGKIRIKVAGHEGFVKFAPEYEDCSKAAKKSGESLLEVMRETEKEAAKIFGRKKR